MVTADSEEEIKKRIETIGTEYQFDCYHEKKPDGCFRFADWLYGFKKDLQKAVSVYQYACDTYSQRECCYKYGRCAFLGEGTPKDVDMAVKYWTKACLMNHASACYNIGVHHWRRENYEASLDNYDRACQQCADAPSCRRLMQIYHAPRTERVAADLSKSAYYAQLGCERGDAACCLGFAELLRKGLGVSANSALADEMERRGRKLIVDSNTASPQFTG